VEVVRLYRVRLEKKKLGESDQLRLVPGLKNRLWVRF